MSDIEQFIEFFGDAEPVFTVDTHDRSSFDIGVAELFLEIERNIAFIAEDDDPLEVEVVDGMAFVSGRHKSNISSLTNSEFGAPFAISGNLAFALKNSIVDNMRISTNISSGFAIGTRIQILGVRA